MTRHSTYDRECGSASRIIGRSIASIAGLWGPPLAGRALSIRRPGASKPYGKRGLGRGLRYIAHHGVCTYVAISVTRFRDLSFAYAFEIRTAAVAPTA